jgi:mono/diheme cytochrome c family protein
MVVFAPIPMASVSTATVVNPGLFRSQRRLSAEIRKVIYTDWVLWRSKALSIPMSRPWLLLATGFLATTGGAATPPFAGADAFLQKNCAGCHNSAAPAARLDLTKLSYEPANPDNFAIWVKVHDRVSAGEMPPSPIARPPAASLTPFVNGLSAALSAYEHNVTTERGRAGLRRLNAYEYENGLRDLLNIP